VKDGQKVLGAGLVSLLGVAATVQDREGMAERCAHRPAEKLCFYAATRPQEPVGGGNPVRPTLTFASSMSASPGPTLGLDLSLLDRWK
jgi:hypothetical protein